MTAEPKAFPDAMYATYLTGQAGRVAAILLFQDGVISGIDADGVTAGVDAYASHYDGAYTLAPDHQHIVGKITVTSPAGVPAITGVSFAERPFTFDVPFEFPVNLDPDTVYRMETPSGPVNAKFKKLRALDNEHE